jgi:hypothetical protein
MAWGLNGDGLRSVRPILRKLLLDYVERREAKVEFEAA